ncbi:MAG: glutamate--tRNA ligase [Methanomassiliicoccus sp.]|nr:glutamate--tRNA ligase [Methanomassiliicoccus sp.]
MSAELREAIRKYALQNAALFGGKANPKAVMGKVLAERPELRSRAKEVAAAAEEVCREVAAMRFEDICGAAESIDPDLLKRTKCERKHVLPELPGAVEGKVVMRMAPGPSGPLHVGHTRVSILNDEYVKRYKGRYILRMEDTNPDKIDPEAYSMIPEDLAWLGVEVHETVIQSDRFEVYYDVARQLIDLGKAYVCTCPAEPWRHMKEEGRACPHHGQAPEEANELFDKMLSHAFSEEEAVLVVKTDLKHPNPAIRDFVGLRIVDSVPHPRTGTRYTIYPMMNLSVATDDHFLGLTHVIRGKDHLNNTLRQEYIFNYLGWKQPWYHHYGLVHIPDSILKTSTIRNGIREGEYSGWDDVRLGTVRAMAKRGIAAEAIRNYWVDVGMKDVDIEFAWDNLYAFNKQIIDPVADRYFFVWDPRAVEITGVDALTARSPLHPDHPERGTRDHDLRAPIMVYMNSEDLEGFKQRGTVRLKDLCNLRWENGKGVYTGNDHSVLREGVKIAHWAPADGTEAEVVMPDGMVRKGVSERLPPAENGKVVQFERFGFARVERTSPNLLAYFTQ